MDKLKAEIVLHTIHVAKDSLKHVKQRQELTHWKSAKMIQN